MPTRRLHESLFVSYFSVSQSLCPAITRDIFASRNYFSYKTTVYILLFKIFLQDLKCKVKQN